MKLPPATDEQLEIIKLIGENYNLKIDSVAGSGKTTTNLYIAKSYPKKRFLLLTYNKKLKLETRRKVEMMQLDNVEVHTFHSFCYKYYYIGCTDDKKLEMIIKKPDKFLPLKPFNYDVIIVDEAQDMTPNYYRVVCKLYNDSNSNAQIIVMGDKMQSIYSFNDADSRFIIHAEELFDFNDYKWKSVKLSESFRITKQMAKVINTCFLKEPRMISKKDGTKVNYNVCDTFAYNRFFVAYNFIQLYHKSAGIKYEDMFVLAPSCRNEKSPVRKLANKLSDEGINIYVPHSDNEVFDEDLIKGKLVFSTFHQAKGLERKVVIVYSMDEGYYIYNDKMGNRKVCPNAIYVAITRATEHLVLLHNYTNDYFPFMGREEIYRLKKLTKYEEDKALRIKKSKTFKKVVKDTELIKYNSIATVNLCLDKMEIIKKKKKVNRIKIDFMTKQGKGYEDISDTLVVAVPSYYELQLTDNMTIYNDMVTKKEVFYNMIGITENKNNTTQPEVDEFGVIIETEERDENENEKINYRKLKDIKKITIPQLLFLATEWFASKSGFGHKINQIKDYKWFDKKRMNLLVDNIKKFITSNNVTFNVKLDIDKYPELLDKTLFGSLDCIEHDILNDKYNVWNFIISEDVKNEEFIKIAIRMYLFHRKFEASSFIFEQRKEQKEGEFNKEIKKKQNYLKSLHNDYKEKLRNEKGHYLKYEYEGKACEGILKRIVKCKKTGKQKYCLKNVLTKKENSIYKKNILENLNNEADKEQLKLKISKLENLIEKKKDQLNEIVNEDQFNFFILNILTGEYYQVKSTMTNLELIIEHLIKIKEQGKVILSNVEFNHKILEFKKIHLADKNKKKILN